jgi:hypothetical protein
MAVNALVAAGALWLIRLYGSALVLGADADPQARRWTQVFVAGLGAMALFRSSLFIFGKEGDEVSIGPNAVLRILLNAIDKEVDRFRGQQRAQSVKGIMENIDYEDAIQDLTVMSKALMQNLSEDDSKKIDEAKKKFEILTDIDAGTRKYLLGLHLMDVVGEDVLRQAINIRGKEHYRAQALVRQHQREQGQQAGAQEQKLTELGEQLKEKYAKEDSAQTGKSKEEGQAGQTFTHLPGTEATSAEAPPGLAG